MVIVHYEIYDGHPLLTKWVSVQTNAISTSVRAGFDVVESLNVNLQWGVFTDGVYVLHAQNYTIVFN